MKSSRSPRLSDLARDDLRATLQYTMSTWGERQRDAYAAAIDAALRKLAAFPALGRSRDDLFAGCRSYRVEHHVIYYHTVASDVTIDRILHAKMDSAVVGQTRDDE
jgi:toxin ParE1/3/4